LDGVSLTVHQGEVVGLLGENGAGKTTLTKVVSTLLMPSSGTVRVLGHDVVRERREARRGQAVVFGGDRGLYDRLTGRENLMFFAVLNGASRRGLADRVDRALTVAGLAPAGDRTVGTYSRGMRQRLHLAIGTINNPKVLLLDEPTVGLDPAEAERLRERVEQLRDRGVAILLTSHHLLDIERLADRVVVLDSGRVTHALSVQELIAVANHVALVVVHGRGTPPNSSVWEGHTFVTSHVDVKVNTAVDGWTVTIPVRSWDSTTFRRLSATLDQHDVLDLQVRSVRLDDVYPQISGSRGA
jgi:ABC-2 type transport system ATP-binding protein